jgi:hypothetical protein
LKKVFVDRPWYRGDIEKPLATISPEERADIYTPIADIPVDEKMRLINLARAQGAIRGDVSDERASVILRSRIERAYAAALAGGNRQQLITIMTKD